MENNISQIKFDEGFIKKLLDKLKIGNTRSIHLNAIPGRSATRLDLFQLLDIEENLPKNFIDKLLNHESFSFEISYDNLDLGKLDDDEKKRLALISKKLNTIVVENNDNYLEFGIKNFAFGFPLLIKRDKTDPTKIIKAPLFIWNLDIERSYQNKNTWFIKREEDYSIKLNELLISHLAKDEFIQLEKISKDILDDGLLDGTELLDLCKNILSQLNAKEENISIKIEKCPDAKQIEDIANSKPWIQWSGIFGIYLSQKETIIQSTEELLENIEKFQNETLILKKFQTSTITAIDTDPSKDEILNTLTKNEIKLIQGPPGTGKSQSITAIISNALANGAKCLIVCEKKTALDVIQSNLEKVGLGKFSILIDDVNKDRKKVIEKARDINDFQEWSNFSELEFNNKYGNYCRIKEEINKKYSEPLKKIFGDFSWKHLIGLYLRFSKSGNFEYLREKLNYDFLQFTHDEYAQYLNIIEEAGYLYEEVEKDSEIIFSSIHNDIFKENFSFKIYEKVKSEAHDFIEVLSDINLFLSNKNKNDFEERQVSIFKENSIGNSINVTENLIKNIEILQNLNKSIFEKINNKKGKLLQILEAMLVFLSTKNANDFNEEKISIFDEEGINTGLDHFEIFIEFSKTILDLFQQGKNIIGDQFYKKSVLNQFTERTFSMFSQKYSHLCKIRKEIFEKIEDLNNEILTVQEIGFLDFTINDFKNTLSFLDLENKISKDCILAKGKYENIKKINEYKKFFYKNEEEIIKLDVNKLLNFEFKNFLELNSYEKIQDFYQNLFLYIQNIKAEEVSPVIFLEQENNEIQEFKKYFFYIIDSINHDKKNLYNLDFTQFKILTFEEYKSLQDINNDNVESIEHLNSIKNKITDMAKISMKIQNFEKKLENILSLKIFNFFHKNYINLGNFEKLLFHYSNLKNNIERFKKHLDSYESFHNWKYFELKRNNNELKILSVLKNIPSNEWKDLFKAWYYRSILLNYEQNSEVGFNKSDKKLQQLSGLHEDLKIQQLKQINYIWTKNRTDKLSSFPYNFNALYNLKKNKTFGRRNSLRKIVETDLGLFTTLFPVILTNPSAVNSIFPLQQGLFEIVIFDEASQLRVSDVFTSLIRGQYKIIAGDKHQMPPSNYFQSNSEILEEENDDDDTFTEEDEQAAFAESESLLEYAETFDKNNKIINKSHLDFHYRSEHPALIEFSNHAFYGGNLISFPSREVYKPIDFRAVNGRYETRTNPSEIAEIIKIIQEEIHPDQKGKYPSLGIATFNINQRNLIIETLNIVAEQDPIFAQKLQMLRDKGLFVKNLENIQGDERDIIIISTTYGIKPDGKFSQNFARLNRIEGYKLLNVLITRAKKKLFICTSIPKEKYLSFNEIIQNEGNNKKGILYAYLTYAEAISNNDNRTAEIVLNTLINQSYETPRIISQNDGLSESPFEEEVYQELLDHFDHKNIIQQYKIGGFRLDFVIKTKLKDIILECDGKAYHQSDEAHAHDIYRQKELENMGFVVYRIWSTNWFQDKEIEIKKFLEFIKTFL